DRACGAPAGRNAASSQTAGAAKPRPSRRTLAARFGFATAHRGDSLARRGNASIATVRVATAPLLHGQPRLARDDPLLREATRGAIRFRGGAPVRSCAG